MQTNGKAAGKIIGMAIFTAFICIFIQLSFHTMIKSLSTEVVEYKVYDAANIDQNDPEKSLVATYKKEDLPKDLDQTRFKAYAVYSEIPTSAKAVEVILSTICSLGVLFCTTGSVLADIAAKDRNNSDFNGAAYNKNRGLKVGLIAVIPAAVAYVANIVLRAFPSNDVINWFFWFYRFIIMGPVKPLNDVMTGVDADLTHMPWWWVFANGLFLVLFVLMCYLMYRICYNEDSWLAKLLYKSKETTNTGRRLGGR